MTRNNSIRKFYVVKKVISCLLVLSLLMLSTSTLFASESTATSSTDNYSFVDESGDIITVQTSVENGVSVAKVYVNGRLAQESTANQSTQSIETVIYDIESEADIPEPTVGESNG